MYLIVFLLIYDVHFMVFLGLAGCTSGFFSVAVFLIKGSMVFVETVEGCVITCYLILYLKY